jgi:hypothetical protein
MTDVPVGICSARDICRVKGVGSHTIKKMALQYLEYLKDYPVVICDLDGTFCDIRHRLHFVKDGNKDWKSFFDNIENDTINRETLYALNREIQKHDAKLIFVSARPEEI